MAFLSCLSVIFGLAAAMIIGLLAKAAGAALGIDTGTMSFSLNCITISPQTARNAFLSPPVLALALAALGAASFAAYRLLGKEKTVACNTWDCGYYKLDARNEYTATAFSKPFRIAFGFFLRPYRKSQKIRESFYHVKSFAYETHTTQVFTKHIYEPIVGLALKTAGMMRSIQPGSIHLYLSYIFLTIFALIFFMGRF